jgi:hypothetical protein
LTHVKQAGGGKKPNGKNSTRDRLSGALRFRFVTICENYPGKNGIADDIEERKKSARDKSLRPDSSEESLFFLFKGKKLGRSKRHYVDQTSRNYYEFI